MTGEKDVPQMMGNAPERKEGSVILSGRFDPKDDDDAAALMVMMHDASRVRGT